MEQLKYIIVACLFLNSCGFVDPASLVNLGLIVVDSAVSDATGKSMSDHAVSTITGQDCRISRIIKGKKICYKTEEEKLLDQMDDMECDHWYFRDNEPVCDDKYKVKLKKE